MSVQTSTDKIEITLFNFCGFVKKVYICGDKNARQVAERDEQK